MANISVVKLQNELHYIKDATARAGLQALESSQNVLTSAINTVNARIDDIEDAKGVANGYAELDENGKVPSAQLPSFVDDVIEGYLNETDGKFYASKSGDTYSSEITGETGKIYVDLDSKKTYRWSGSLFAEISESLALGETSTTAYRGDKGKENADAITAIKDGTDIDSFKDVEDSLESLDKANINLIKDTVGWAGKNLCPNELESQTKNDLNITVHSDKSITIDGTPSTGTWLTVCDTAPLKTGSYILSGCPANGTANWGTYKMYVDLSTGDSSAPTDIGNGKTFTVATDCTMSVRIFVGSAVSSLTFYPMIRRADITDDTYEPYHTPVIDTVQQTILKDVIGYTGKNLFHLTFQDADSNGITIKCNNDGTFTVNGTLTDSATRVVAWHKYQTPYAKLPTGDYIVSLQSSANDINANWILTVVDSSDNMVASWDCTAGSNAKRSWPSSYTNNNYSIYSAFEIPAGTTKTFDNEVFYPMIRRAEITDPTYEPYHESIEIMYEEEMHGINLLRNEGVTQTIYGVTFTPNSDGSVTVNGTATDAVSYIMINGRSTDHKITIPDGDYILSSGQPYNSATNFVFLSLMKDANYVHQDIGTTKTEETAHFTLANEDYDALHFGIHIASGTTVNNLVFRPMLRKAEIEDSTYRPYNEQAVQNWLSSIQNQLNDNGVLGAKNLLKFPYYHVSGLQTPIGSSITNAGITYTVNADGSIIADGTATGGSYYILRRKQDWPDFDLYGKRIKLSIEPVSANVFIQLYDTDNSRTLFRTDSVTGEVEFMFPTSLENNTSWNISINFPKNAEPNNTTYYPMLCFASDPDDTYVPYAPTNAMLNKEKMSYVDNRILGAKNLIQYPYRDGDTHVHDTLTFTCDTNGIITVNGTATALADYVTGDTSDLSKIVKLQNGTSYIISGCPVGGSNQTYRIRTRVYQNNVETIYQTIDEYGDGKTFYIPNDNNTYYAYVYIHIMEGQTLTNLIFKPMLRLASDPDNTFAPYAMTNRELTEVTTKLLTISDSTVTGRFRVTKIGKIVTITAWSVQGTTITQGAPISKDIPLPLDYVAAPLICANASGAMGGLIYIDGTNTLNLHVYTANKYMYGSLTYVCK